jgi:glycerophosphoryl diester phosphodiesterase
MPANNPFYLIGHRGAAGERLENSMEGFVHAQTLPIDAVEIDIRENDSTLWIFHDDRLDRMTDHSGSFDDYADLSRVRLRNGEPIPTLRELLDRYWGKMPLNIEIKSMSNLSLLLDLLDAYPVPGVGPGLPWIFISAFDHDYLRELKRMDCRWPLAPLNDKPPADTGSLLDEIQPRSWHFGDDRVDLALVEQLDEAGIMSLVYTVNDAGRAAYLRDHGVKGIFTDEPSQLLQELK